MNECKPLKLGEVQGLLCGTLQTIIQKLAGGGDQAKMLVLQFGDPIMQVSSSSSLQPVHATAIKNQPSRVALHPPNSPINCSHITLPKSYRRSNSAMRC